MRRSGAPVLFVIGGLGLWFGPWHATVHHDGAASVQVVCAAAPVDLVLYPPGATSGITPTSDACRTSAWWRTMFGTLMLGAGIGAATRDRTAARVARLSAA